MNNNIKVEKNMFSNINTLLFDLDGTLIDSMFIWRQIDLDFLTLRHIDMDPIDLQKDIEGLSMYETADYFIKSFSMTETPEELGQIWNEMAIDYYRDKAMMQPGAMEFLMKAKELGYKMAIASSNSPVLIETVMKSRGFDDLIGNYVTADMVKHGKPFPDVYLRAASDLSADPSECMVFEDITAGINAGINAGMKTVAFDDKYSRYCFDEKVKLADYSINDYRQIINFL